MLITIGKSRYLQINHVISEFFCPLCQDLEARKLIGLVFLKRFIEQLVFVKQDISSITKSETVVFSSLYRHKDTTDPQMKLGDKISLGDRK